MAYSTLAGDTSTGSTSSFPIGGALLLVFVAVWLVMAIVMVVAWVKIISREGYSGAWVLVGLVPLLNVIMFLVFAFKESPVRRELRQLRSWAASSGFHQGPPSYGPGPGYYA